MPLFVSDIEYDAVRHDVSAVVARADEKVRELLIQVEVQKARADAAAINAEQTCALLEQKYLALAAEQSQLEQDKDQLASSLAERSAELAEAKSQAQQLQLEAVRRDGEAERHQVEIAELHRGKRELLELTEHKNAELDEKNSSIKAYLEKIVALTNERARVEAELLEERAEAARARAMQARLTQEKELLDQHNSWLNAELTTKSEALLEERRKSGEVEAELRTKLTEVDKNCKDASDMAKRLKDRVKDLENQLSQTREELKYVKDEAASQEEHFTGEIATASKLASLYKESSEGWSKKCNELEGVVKALETHLTQMETEYRLKLEKAVADKAAEAKVFSERISAIEKEAEEAKEELAQVRSQPELLSLAWRSPEGPSEPGEGQEPLVADFQEASFRSRVPEMSHAALAASLVREGWTLTTMYAKYQEAADAWRHEKQERLHAQSLLDRVYYEIEQKATVIIEEREKHFRMVQSYKIMEDKLKESAAFKGELEASLREAKALVRDREREIKSLEKEASDLLTQLAYLVKENAALGEGQGPSRVELELPIMPMSQGEESAADAVISGRLLTFKDAYDLVKINASLRRSLRDLALQNETKEEEIKKAFDEQLSKRNEANRKALLELKERMEQRDEAIKALKEQLAMYKRLYDDEVKIHSSQVLANGNGVEDGASPDYRRLFESVQEELQKLREETTQQAKALQKDVDKARDEASAARVERGKADGEARFAKEQYESLQRAMEDQRKEMEAVLSRNMEFSQLITDYQRKLREASQDVARAEDEARRKTIEASVLEREKELLISAETRASQEAKTLSERVHRLQAVLDTSQIAEQAREESKVAERQRHVAEAQRLQREWVESKKELEMERNHSRDLIIARDKAVAEVKAKLEAAEAACANAERACQETERRAKTAESRVEALQQELKEAEEKLAVLHAGTEDDSKDSETSDKEAQLSQSLGLGMSWTRTLNPDPGPTSD
ncbi:hypothetical protein CBR_g33916 [Chara braunii]|uniref:Nucleoprotein TPR/MLP1 domain-containing protein n=1 Tax=Chara braunii TaxID=69332 RepID=A0A388LHI6_CHABU|nr:hypothetical protein CBR_g33916 [Chara braunii]|eukprot:GBG81737.1 hypothetical protein CBR_g33916 [Chara braunii]